MIILPSSESMFLSRSSIPSVLKTFFELFTSYIICSSIFFNVNVCSDFVGTAVAGHDRYLVLQLILENVKVMSIGMT